MKNSPPLKVCKGFVYKKQVCAQKPWHIAVLCLTFTFVQSSVQFNVKNGAILFSDLMLTLNFSYICYHHKINTKSMKIPIRIMSKHDFTLLPIIWGKIATGHPTNVIVVFCYQIPSSL